MKAEIKVTLKMNARELLLLTNFLGGQSRQLIAKALNVDINHPDAYDTQQLTGYLYDILNDLKG